MASKKRLSDSVVVNLLQQMLDSQNDTREALTGRLDGLAGRLDALTGRVDAVVAEQRSTNERLDRLEKAVVGIGRMTALEDRVRRVEAHLGLAREP